RLVEDLVLTLELDLGHHEPGVFLEELVDLDGDVAVGNLVSPLLDDGMLCQRVQHGVAVRHRNLILVLRATGADREALDGDVRPVACAPDAHRALLIAVEIPLPVVSALGESPPGVALDAVLSLDLLAHVAPPTRW